MDQPEVRVRIAPSPSGYVHVGTARTAIFNYLFARRYGGKFLVRIENTDTERSDPKFTEAILSALTWLGMQWDEDIIYQADRLDIYKEHVQTLAQSGNGYPCFCTTEMLAADRDKARAEKTDLRYNRRCLKLSSDEVAGRLAAGEPHTIRLRIPEGDCTFDDMVSGELVRNSGDIEDFIVARSDGSATYNLAVVVDDHATGITHVLRGNDHITNTFKQIHLYTALGFDIPKFAHVPMILRTDKKKVSKSRGDKDVLQFRNEGVLPEAMFNYLCLLGWSPKTDREIYSVDELISSFTPDNFNPSNSVFDEEKLIAFNQEYIAATSDHDLAVLVAPLLVEAGLTTKYWLETRWEYLRQVIGTLKLRARRIVDFVQLSGYFFEFDYKYDPEAAAKQFTAENGELLTALSERFERLEAFTPETIEPCLSALAEEKGLKKGRLIHPTRLAVSGRPTGPSLYEMLAVLSQPVVVGRMRRAVEQIELTNNA
ncbi:MAG: glutamate--tRNA ligase [candidate division Zixibacteria bacterium]|nr:glutamate--tRNA ligase [candidate division Zixibacteria bacterium]MDH3937131.1 glutamate--tRNA ligase [candidate division Zixibacteria bacterium]MDH4033722.1 glutamate--tRNA ligase [candidate division Zixibacteria bacterium]